MNLWQITEPRKIEQVSKVKMVDSVDLVKVKISKVLLNNTDIAIYGGLHAAKLPIIPGRSAVGLVTEVGSDNYQIAKNSRVYIKPLKNCGVCYDCKHGNANNCLSMSIAGENANGFLQDYIVVPMDNLALLPDSVSDSAAIYIDLVALATSIITKMDIRKGEHVAIIGGKTLGNIIAQLLIYYQAVPIIIDSNNELLEAAAASGVYYTLNTADYKEKFNVITGGRNAEHTIYIYGNISANLAFELTAAGGKICFTGADYSAVNVDLLPAYEKQLNAFFITNGFGNTESAINLIANKALKLDGLLYYESKFDDVPAAFEKYLANMQSDNLGRNLIINLI